MRNNSPSQFFVQSVRNLLNFAAPDSRKPLWNALTSCAAVRCRPAYNTQMEITLPELEEAINYWRSLRPSMGEERALSPEVNSLATVYAMMIFDHQKATPVEQLDPASRQLIDRWRENRV